MRSQERNLMQAHYGNLTDNLPVFHPDFVVIKNTLTHNFNIITMQI